MNTLVKVLPLVAFVCALAYLTKKESGVAGIVIPDVSMRKAEQVGETMMLIRHPRLASIPKPLLESIAIALSSNKSPI